MSGRADLGLTNGTPRGHTKAGVLEAGAVSVRVGRVVSASVHHRAGVRVHKFAQTQTDDYGNLIYPDIFRAKLVQLSVVDENDQLVFKDSDVSALTGKSAATVAQVFLASCELNCLTNAEVAKARANFLQALKSALGSGSLNDSEKPTSPSSGNG